MGHAGWVAVECSLRSFHCAILREEAGARTNHMTKQATPFEGELTAYLEATKSLRLNESQPFEAFNATASELLALIRHRWPAPAAGWLDVVRRTGRGALSREDFIAAQRELTTYRTETLREPAGNVDTHSDEAAISFLFQMAVDVRPEPGSSAYTGTSLVRLIDEFAHEFIEHFGMSAAVVSALKRNF